MFASPASRIGRRRTLGMPSYGTYAARPNAVAAGQGFEYYATDVQELYLSTGAAWIVVPSGGTQLGYAQVTANQSTTSSVLTDLTGLSITCMVGERPILIKFGSLVTNSSNNYCTVALLSNGSQVINGNYLAPVAGASMTSHLQYVVQPGTLTPGQSYTFKAQFNSPFAIGTASIQASATSPSWIQALTA